MIFFVSIIKVMELFIVKYFGNYIFIDIKKEMILNIDYYLLNIRE